MRAKQFLVIGAGRFGSSLARTLFQQGHEVVVIDRDEATIERLVDGVTHALIGDATDEQVLRKVGVSNFDTVIVAIGTNFEANVLATVSAKSLGAKHVIAKATSDTAASVLARVGADQVVRPEHDMGRRLAQQLTTPELVEAFNLGAEHKVIEVEANDKLIGTLAKLRLTNRFSVQVIAVNRRGDVTVSPGAGYEVQRGDILVLIGSNGAVERFRAHLTD